MVPDKADDLRFMGALEQAELIRTGAISALELAETYLQRIDELNPVLNAFVTVATEQAKQMAAEADRKVRTGERTGPFNGVPIAIKDLSSTAGIRTTFSSALFADNVPDHDDFVVRRLRDAGFTFLGKTNTPEFGSLPVTESALNGACRNPWDLEKTAGGSSGGSAAAVIAGLAPVAHGSDGGGSVRIPASCCGLVGLKPARGRISAGPGDSTNGFSVNGFLGRNVADIAALLDVSAGYETGDPYWAPPPPRSFLEVLGTDPKQLRIALCTTSPLRGSVHPDCSAAAQDAAALLEELGHHVAEAAPDFGPEDVVESLDKLWLTSAAPYADEQDLDQLEPAVQVFSRRAMKLSSYEYARAAAVISRASRRFVSFWDDYDLLLTPTLSLPPVPIGWYFGGKEPDDDLVRDHTFFSMFTPFANVTGQPAVSLPLSWNADGLPIGVQLIGPPADEALLLQISARLEQARPWAHRRPPSAQPTGTPSRV